MYVFLKNESDDITKVKTRFFKNPELLGNDNREKRIEVSVKDSSFLASCI